MMKLWDAATGTLLHTFEGGNPAVTSVAFSPDGKRLLGSAFEEVKLWDTATGGLLRTFEETAAVPSAAFSPDGKQLLSGARKAR